jgi:hypothetical protein
MKSIVAILCLFLYWNLGYSQRPTFVDFLNSAEDIKNIAGIYEQTPTTYIGIYTKTAGLSRDSPYYIVYDLSGQILTEGQINVSIPHYTYSFLEVIQTPDFGFIMQGDDLNLPNRAHCIKFDRNMQEEWRIVSSKFDTINGLVRVPRFSTVLNDTLYSLTTSNYNEYYLTTIDLGSGQILAEIQTNQIDSSLIGFNYPTRFRRFKNEIYFNLQNSFQNDWQARSVHFGSLDDISVAPIPVSRLTHSTYNLLINDNQYLLFRDSVSSTGAVFDVFNRDGTLVKTNYLDFPKSRIGIHAHSTYNNVTSVLISLNGETFVNKYNSGKLLYTLLKVDSLGNIINNFQMAQYHDDTLRNLYFIHRMQQLEDGSYSFIFTPTPGIPRTPNYIAIVDSELKVNGSFFLEQFFDTLTSSTNTPKKIIPVIHYPNPVSSTLTIELDEKVEYILLNQKGQIIAKDFLNAPINTIDFSNYSQGLYFLRLQNENFSITRKVVKN